VTFAAGVGALLSSAYAHPAVTASATVGVRSASPSGPTDRRRRCSSHQRPAGPTMHQLWPMHLKRKRVLSPSTQ
jgi:hypothetical protein